jgi:hypothetical protein
MSTVIQIEGEPKTGKTTLALSFANLIPVQTPQHYVRYFEMDVGGLGRAKVKYQQQIDDGRIVHKTYFLPQQGIREQILGKAKIKQSERLMGIKELWYEMLTDYINALDDPNCDAVIFDTWAQVWNLCPQSVLQEKQEWDIKQNKGSIREKLLQIEYGEPNSRMRAIIYAAVEAEKDLVLLAHMQDTYGKAMVDGQIKETKIGTEAAGWRYTDKELNTAISMRTDWVQVNGEKKLRPIGKIRLCGDTLDAVGMEFQSPTWELFRDYIKMLRGE